MSMSSKQITVECPKCEAANVVSLQQVADQSQIKCVGCEVNIDLVDDNGSTKKSIQNIEQALKQLPKELSLEIKL